MTSEPRIRLVPLEDEHIARYMALSHDPILIETKRWRPFEANERERFLRYIDNITVPNMAGGHAITFSIVTAAEGKPIGYLSLKGVRDGGTGAEIGLAIMDQDYSSEGIVTEALRQGTRYAFEELEIFLLELTVFPDDTAAIHSYEKVGFVRTDILKEAWQLPTGILADMWVMELYRPSPELRLPGI